MRNSKSNSTESTEELCKNICKRGIEKLEALAEEIRNLQRLSKEKTPHDGEYGSRNCPIHCCPGHSTGVNENSHEVNSLDVNQKPSEPIKKVDSPERNSKPHIDADSSILNHTPLEGIAKISSTSEKNGKPLGVNKVSPEVISLDINKKPEPIRKVDSPEKNSKPHIDADSSILNHTPLEGIAKISSTSEKNGKPLGVNKVSPEVISLDINKKPEPIRKVDSPERNSKPHIDADSSILNHTPLEGIANISSTSERNGKPLGVNKVSPEVISLDVNQKPEPIRKVDSPKRNGKPHIEADSSILNNTPSEAMSKISSTSERNGKPRGENISLNRQKSSLKQTSTTPKQSVTICEKHVEENHESLVLNCHEGKICPTIGAVVNRKFLQDISVLSLESDLCKKISEVIQSQSENLKSRGRILDSNTSESEAYNCQEERPCPTINSILASRAVPKHDVKKNTGTDPSKITKTPPAQINSSQSNKKQSGFSFKNNIEHEKHPLKWSCRNGKPCPAFAFLGNEISPNKTEKEVRYGEGNPSSTIGTVPSIVSSGKSSRLSSGTDRQVTIDPSRINYLTNELDSEESEKSVKVDVISQSVGTADEKINETDIDKKTNEKGFVEKSSIELKSTDLSGKSKHSASTLSHEECDKENKLDKWKVNCLEGKYSLKSLIEMCENDPDFLLASFKTSSYTDIKLLHGSTELVEHPEQFYKYESIFGEEFGDPKYHLLMVDDSTSLAILDTKSKPKLPEPVPEIATEPDDSDSSEPEEEVVEEEELVKQKDYQVYAELTEEETEVEKISRILASPPPENLEEPEERSFLPNKDKKLSILVRDDRGADPDEEKKQNGKRTSTVSWRAMGTTSESDSTASLEQVVKDATAKAESFRQNLDTRRQHSLLDIVKRKSIIDKKIEEEKPSSPPVKRKKFFNFKLCQKKKPPPPKEKVESDADDVSSEDELDDRKAKQSSSLHVDIYRRRNTSVIENPVFEKNKELNQFLNNI